MSEVHKNLPAHAFLLSEWEAWLDKHHTNAPGIWLKLAKKGSGIATVTYIEARDTAIRYGWIDGLINKYDESYYLIKFTPRGPKSVWSKINKAIAESFIENNQMKPFGLMAVEQARKNGQWDMAYDAPSTMEIPADFALALKKNPQAEAFYQTISKSNRYGMFYRLSQVKTPEKRSVMIEKFIAMLTAEEVLHPARKLEK